ncbi:uncharacterized protein LOC129944364 [Eupeodes corollae]|uniref:uncharacterized protein LOC129944364 n=1 Tax=Eupeodes corollae TaxID=290404 RepID=UPI00248FCCF6|nr:uncharacterized protein LOC129944364 [Eupeodes corollae]
MVLWLQSRFAVILIVLNYLTCAKTENDLQTISSSSMDLMQRGLQSYCAKLPFCRYKKILTALKDSFNLNSESSSSNYSNMKQVKKNLATDRQTEVLEGGESFEGGELPSSADSGLVLEDLEKNDLAINSYDDLDLFKPDEAKRGNSLPSIGCDCKVKNELLDLGHLYYPRYLFNAVCHKDDRSFEYTPKCLPGSQCRPLEYKVRVLTHRSHNDHLHKDPSASLLPDTLRSVWKFKTVTIAAGCFCS